MTKPVVVDALMYRRVKKGTDRTTLSLEHCADDHSLYDVFIETNRGTQFAEARFDSIHKAVEFFDYATRQVMNDQEAEEAFDAQKAKSTFFAIQ